MSTTVDIESVSRNLILAWNDSATSVSKVPLGMKEAIDGVMSASDVTFKYILVTGYVAKATNPRIHARCLQTGSSLKESYDARSVCHKAVIPFEKTKGNLFGLSNEPFVNKPARHAEHSQDNDQLRNKGGSRLLHAALEEAQRGTPEQVFAGLAYILSRGKERSESEKVADVSHEVTMPRVQKFCRDFLSEADGGVRLVAVWGAFVSLLTEDAKIKVESPNASDQFTKTAGDVEVVYDKTIVSASECKQRPISTDDVNHGLRKAARSGVPEYLFVISAGFVAGQESAVLAAIAEGNKQRDTALVNIFTELPSLVRSLNPKRRGMFGDVVVSLCRQMRKFDSANAAAVLWNSITN